MQKLNLTTSLLEPRPELSSVPAEHCSAPFSPFSPVAVYARELPYHDLGGSGFERLCYELLLKEQPSRPPRFFGVSGQAQYGIDLIADEPDGSIIVYQCKNLNHPLKQADLSRILKLFETEWLGNAKLPKPKRFVLCCPQDFADSKARDYWQQQTGDPIQLGIWSRDDLDSRLRKAPDIVADLFSDDHVHAFCDHADDWKPDIFSPIKEGVSLPMVLKRYQQRQKEDRLYHDAAYQKEFDEILERERVLLIQGLPATGKTLMATAFARTFQDGRWRVYYLNVAGSGANAEAILQGIRQRLSRPTLILLDNVHTEHNLVETVFTRLQNDLNLKPLGLILISRHIPAEIEERGDDWDLGEQLQERQAVLNFSNKPDRFAKLIAKLKPDFTGLNPKRLDKLMALTGGDFLLLDDMLETLSDPEEIDSLDVELLLTRVKKHYFGAGAVYLPTITRLTALAQFDLNPLAAHFHSQWQTDEQARCRSLMVLIGQPPRYQFLHSSLAELIFQALTHKGKQDSFIIETLMAYLQADSLEPGDDLIKVLSAPLPLLGQDKSRALKAQLLENAELQAIIFGLNFEQAKLAVISRALNLLKPVESTSVARFTLKLTEALQQWFDHADEYPDCFDQCLFAINILRQVAQDTILVFERQINAIFLPCLIKNNGTVVELFKWIEKTNSAAARELIALLDPEKVSRLVDNTILNARSIGTLDLALFTLRKNAPDVGLSLEKAIGAEQLLKLIESNGTLFELFRFAQRLNTKTARELIALLDENKVSTLVDKTISNTRSISTLHLALFELRKNAPDIGLSLEQAIGASHLLKLILSNGTLFELFKFAEHLNPKTARELIALLDENKVSQLVDKTISNARSIGTLHFALFTLRKNAPDVGLSLEQAIGAEQLLKLIVSNGTLFELFMFARRLSTKTARELIASLDDNKVNQLVDKTISIQRSIGTLSLTLSDLKQRDPSCGKALEAKLGAARFWRLLSSLGNPKTIADLTESMSEGFANAVLVQARYSEEFYWNALFKRGNLFEAADFITRCPTWGKDASLQPIITASLQQNAENQVDESDWYGLNTTALKLAQATDNKLLDILQAALQKRLLNCSIDSLSFTDFSEAVHALSCLARETPSNKPLLAQNLWRLLPPPANWLKPAESFMRNARILFGLLADAAFDATDAQTMLEIGMAVDKTKLLNKASTLDIMLYWWSLYSLWFVHVQTNRFAETIPKETLQGLQKRVEHLAKQKLNREENLFLLALLGLLFFLDIPPSRSCLKNLADKFAKQQLDTSILESFVPLYFGANGLQKLFPNKSLHPFEQLQLQMLAKQYPNPTPAVTALYATLTKPKGV